MSVIFRSFALVFVLALVGGASCPAQAAQNTDPIQFIQNLGDQAVSILADKSITVEQRNEKFRGMLRDSFDLLTIGRFVIGRAWNSATPDQQKEYVSLFESLVIKTYSDRFSLYTGEGFKARLSRSEGDKDFIVSSDITHPDGSPPTTVDWRVRLKNGKLGILDVVVEGVSMSVTQRQEYSSIIQRNGGDIEGLLVEMRNRVNAPSKK
ncbi:MAG: ABC transporter substrate-binding protein [Alphaproteobacteria bacterium]|nr:ABC transporter substrate-binding protein [Alphaproteobacteria bacterium]